MESIRTSSLFHFSGNQENLRMILAHGFKPNYCREEFKISKNEIYEVGIPMVSFCDIPLTRITNFVVRYNEYAIGLSKEWGLRNNINPILYAHDDNIYRSLESIRDSYLEVKQRRDLRFKEKGKPMTLNNTDGFAIGYNLLEPSLKNEILDLEKLINSSFTRSILFGYTKPYQSSRVNYSNCYEENEWRYVLRESEFTGVKYLWGSNECNLWRGQLDKPKPESTFQTLKFDIDDVNFIILKEDCEIPQMIEYIKELSDFGGSVINDETKKMILISRIISVERIIKDF